MLWLAYSILYPMTLLHTDAGRISRLLNTRLPCLYAPRCLSRARIRIRARGRDCGERRSHTSDQYSIATRTQPSAVAWRPQLAGDIGAAGIDRRGLGGCQGDLQHFGSAAAPSQHYPERAWHTHPRWCRPDPG